MNLRSGRVEKRPRVATQVQLLLLCRPGVVEGGKTENVSAHGARVLTSHPMRLQEPLLVTSNEGNVNTYAHVIYCEPLHEGGYAVGLRFDDDG